jgi:Zn/Cd-binding protein ZinT
MTNKKLWAGIFGVALVFSFVLAGCDKSGGDSEPEPIWLADLQNPFVGHWESEIPSMNNAKLVSEYKNDGTFTCDFPENPEFGGPFEGGYSVTGDILIGWLDFEGASAYKFKVVDNDTIDVTEINEVKEGGELTLGNTAPFVRVAGSVVNRENKPLSLANVFIGGKWKSQIPSMGNAEMVSEYKTDGTFTCGFPAMPEYEGPFHGAYFVFEDKMASWLDFEGVAAYKFEAVDLFAINVTEFDNLEEGNTSVFVREAELSAWTGSWNAMDQYLDNSGLDQTWADGAVYVNSELSRNDVTVDQVKTIFKDMLKTDFKSCIIEGDTMKIYASLDASGSPSDTIVYAYKGLLEDAWHSFEGNKAGNYKYLIAYPLEPGGPDAVEHFHFRYGASSFDALTAEAMSMWMATVMKQGATIQVLAASLKTVIEELPWQYIMQ